MKLLSFALIGSLIAVACGGSEKGAADTGGGADSGGTPAGSSATSSSGASSSSGGTRGGAAGNGGLEEIAGEGPTNGQAGEGGANTEPVAPNGGEGGRPPGADGGAAAGGADVGEGGLGSGGESGVVLPVLDPPQNVVATDGVFDNRVDVSWDAVLGAESYELSIDGDDWTNIGADTHYSDLSAPPGSFLSTGPTASDGTHTDIIDLALGAVTLVPATTRSYRVRAVAVTGDSAASVADTGYRASSGPIALQWQRSAADTDADYTDLDGKITSTELDATAPASGEGRYYRAVLTAVGVGPTPTRGDRGYRGLPAPVSLNATDGSDTGGVYVTWDAAPGAPGYQVHDGTQWNDVGNVTAWRDTNAPLGAIQLEPVTATDGDFMSRVRVSTSAPTAVPGTPRSYKVRAIGPSGSGPDSATDSGYRGVSGLFSVALERSAADSDADYHVSVANFMFSGGPKLTADDPQPPVDPNANYYRFEVFAAGAASVVSSTDRGYARPRPTLNYTITTRTGNVANGDTDECVYAEFWGKEEYFSGPITLDHAGNDRELGQTDSYSFSSGELGGSPCMYIWITNECQGGANSSVNGWYVLDVRLQDSAGDDWLWTIDNWLDDVSGATQYYLCQ